ncbi:MAG: cell division control Cdc6 [Lasallia pustulata]|uniref:Cell division control protein n=1 Tax=Lasallia pustulata TaxID=136370 RepID=A0A5M8Q1L3_9LECA|nr:MAG: cell division control Cdc6 [Lasallia pustulata]
MASTVLGKRARACEATAEPSSVASRVKRRTRVPIINDENADPSLSQNAQTVAQHVECMETDELENPSQSLTEVSTAASIPAKHTVNGGRVAFSPTTINGHFKATKSVPREPSKRIQSATPQTPRHRDALSKKGPVTPRHRVIVPGKPLTPCTPRTKLTPSTVPTIYHTARQQFVRSANPGRLIGREEERNELNDFIKGGIELRLGRSLYVSGPPGTGKSALVNEVCEDLQGLEHVKTAYVNCMSVKNTQDIYGKLLEQLVGDNNEVFENDEKVILQNLFLPGKSAFDHVYIVALDEIDHLLTLDLEILYTLFEWSLQRSSRLILIGIANALDLTDRFLPRLKARNLKPQLLPFLPYTAAQIASVITTRLKSLLPSDSPTTTPPDYIPFIHPAAIQLCSKKVASQTGDLRKAFDIIRRTLDLIDAETKQSHQHNPDTQSLQTTPSKLPLTENANLASPPTSSPLKPNTPPNLAASLRLLTPASAPRATIAHIARVSASTFSNGTSQRLQTLNLQQKAALCALISLEKNNKVKEKSHSSVPTPSSSSSKPTAPTVRTLHETYAAACRRDNSLHPLSGTEFADVMGSLETMGLVGGWEGRAGWGWEWEGEWGRGGDAAEGDGHGEGGGEEGG